MLNLQRSIIGDFLFQFLLGTLKISAAKAVTPMFGPFQFLLGTLKILKKFYLEKTWTQKFQFLLGTLKIDYNFEDVINYVRFQFLLGTLKISRLSSPSFNFVFVSIPLRYSKNSRWVTRNISSRIRVSIPLRYSKNAERFGFPKIKFRSFNSS